MKYRTLYQMLDRRRADNLNFSYTDYSGWRERPPTYLSRSRPLWIIAEDQGIGYRFWITQSGRDMVVSYAKMTAGGSEKNISRHRKCRRISDLTAEVSKLFAELDALAAT